jgi:mRNA-degrading endonuclease RelE of RelBE toxin-antitoxin system
LIHLKNSSVKRTLQRTKRFGRDVKKLPSDVQKEAYQVALLLAGNVFHPELNIRELTGFKGSYRVVVLKDYRMIFSFDSSNVYLLRIAHRKDIYRKLEL